MIDHAACTLLLLPDCGSHTVRVFMTLRHHSLTQQAIVATAACNLLEFEILLHTEQSSDHELSCRLVVFLSGLLVFSLSLSFMLSLLHPLSGSTFKLRYGSLSLFGNAVSNHLHVAL